MGWHALPAPQKAGPPAGSFTQAVAHEQQRVEDKQDARTGKRILSTHARLQTLSDLLDERLSALPWRGDQPFIELPSQPNDLCIMFPLTDPHTGGYTCPDESGERFAFDSAVFEQRFARWEAGVTTFILRMQALGRVPYISIPSLGDVIENALMRPGAERHTDETNVNAVVTFSDLLGGMVHRLKERFPEVLIDLEFLDGNHDRITEIKGSRPTSEYYTGLAYHFVLRLLAKVPGVRVFRHYEQSAIVSIGGSDVLLYHGHGISGGAVPHKAVETKAERFVAFHRRRFQVMVIGHFHHNASWTTNGGIQVVMCPAFADSSNYAAGLGLANRGMQKALVFEQGLGLTYEYPLYLGDPIPPSPVHLRWQGAS